MSSINLQNPAVTAVLLTEPLTTSSATPQSTDLTAAAGSLMTYAVEGTLLLSSADPELAGAVVGIVWPNGCLDGVATIEVGGVVTEGNIGANLAADPAVHPGPGSWPATVRATFVTGESPSGSFVITLASSDDVTDVSIGAGSWLRVWALG